LLARSVDFDGNVVEDLSDPDFAWLARHSWEWDPARLDELIRAAGPVTLYICGGADNELELADPAGPARFGLSGGPASAHRRRPAGTSGHSA
jgi:hypothetical protein